MLLASMTTELLPAQPATWKAGTAGGPDSCAIGVPSGTRGRQAIQRIGTPTLRPSSYQRAELNAQSHGCATKPARTGFSCMYVSFSRSFCSLYKLKA
jgi:hypothetical protein